MQNFTLQTMLMSQTLVMASTAYAISQSSRKQDGDQMQEEELPKEKKAQGFKGLIKKLNPVRLFAKLFKKNQEKETSEDEVELDL